MTSPNNPTHPLAKRAKTLAMDLRRFQRQEMTQGHLSPTDASFLTRLQNFLDIELPAALAGKSDKNSGA